MVLKVNLKHIKRSRGESNLKEFAFCKDNILLYNPLIPIIALAFANNVFANKFNNLEDIYNLVIPTNLDYL
jgi:hypothetical protein